MKEELNERKAHHPREATLGLKNELPITKTGINCKMRVGACIARPQNKNAITIISLIITIIILLILAGVTLNLTIGENGIFKLASNAAKNYEIASNQEQIELSKASNTINEYVNETRITPENLQWKLWNPLNNTSGVTASGTTEVPLPTTFNEIKISVYDGSRYNYSILLTLHDIEISKGFWAFGYHSNYRALITIKDKKISMGEVVFDASNVTSASSMWIYYR